MDLRNQLQHELFRGLFIQRHGIPLKRKSGTTPKLSKTERRNKIRRRNKRIMQRLSRRRNRRR